VAQCHNLECAQSNGNNDNNKADEELEPEVEDDLDSTLSDLDSNADD
jgi:hypothetical protein